MSYLLDTKACIALINGDPALVRARFKKVVDAGVPVLVPSIVVFELCYGVAKSARAQANAKRVETFLAGPVRVLAFGEDDGRRAGAIRSALELAGKQIGAYDVLIAGQALCRKLTLVTANAKEFGRVKGLVWDDWGRN